MKQVRRDVKQLLLLEPPDPEATTAFGTASANGILPC